MIDPVRGLDGRGGAILWRVIAIGFAILMALPAAGAPKDTPPPPIVVHAGPTPIHFGNWSATDWGDYAEAHTSNESGSVFGVLCGKTCVFYVNFQTICHNGEGYPAMLNSPEGASQLNLQCYHDDRFNVLTFTMEPELVDMVGRGGEVGFAIPLKGGGFSVSRFSLDGGLNAVKSATSMAQKKIEQSQPGLRDFTI